MNQQPRHSGVLCTTIFAGVCIAIETAPLGCASPQEWSEPVQFRERMERDQPPQASGSNELGSDEEISLSVQEQTNEVSQKASVRPPWVHENPQTSTACPPEMVLVEGEYCPRAAHRCADWISEERDRCAKYIPPPFCEGKRARKRFCIDRFEYPNLEGVKPVVMVDWLEARSVCKLEGKRLCTSSEWTLACEGNEILPYPYGYTRDPSVCNIDRPRPIPEPDFEAFAHPRQISAEVARLDLRVGSGGMPQCISPFGVYDMTGNVDEWVFNEARYEPVPRGKERPPISGLKGGYWGPVRARCRPITEDHNEWFRFYQVGFRCCADATVAPSPPAPLP